jgi:hypothetical protein
MDKEKEVNKMTINQWKTFLRTLVEVSVSVAASEVVVVEVWDYKIVLEENTNN